MNTSIEQNRAPQSGLFEGSLTRIQDQSTDKRLKKFPRLVKIKEGVDKYELAYYHDTWYIVLQV
jgi:hypothetical protein